MRAKRTDANQVAIVDAFRKFGFSVFVTSALGNGFPDLVIGKRGQNYLIEVKDGSKFISCQKLTKKEQQFFDEWRGQVMIIKSIDEVINFANTLAFFEGAP